MKIPQIGDKIQIELLTVTDVAKEAIYATIDGYTYVFPPSSVREVFPRLLAVGDKVQTLGSGPKNRYYRVLAIDGDQAWLCAIDMPSRRVTFFVNDLVRIP